MFLSSERLPFHNTVVTVFLSNIPKESVHHFYDIHPHDNGTTTSSPFHHLTLYVPACSRQPPPLPKSACLNFVLVCHKDLSSFCQPRPLFSWQVEDLLSAWTITRSSSISCLLQPIVLYLLVTPKFLPRQDTCTLPRIFHLSAYCMIVFCLRYYYTCLSQRPVICFPTTPYFFSWQTEGLSSSCTITRSFSVSCSPQRLLLFLPATSTFLPRQYTCSLPRTCYLLAHRMIVFCLHRDTSFDVQQPPPHTITPIRTPSS